VRFVRVGVRPDASESNAIFLREADPVVLAATAATCAIAHARHRSHSCQPELRHLMWIGFRGAARLPARIPDPDRPAAVSRVPSTSPVT
jgi:hypothetical protein